MGYTRTNHRTMNFYNRKTNPMDVVGKLVDMMGAQETADYLEKYPTAALKVYAAEVKIRELAKKAEAMKACIAWLEDDSSDQSSPVSGEGVA